MEILVTVLLVALIIICIIKREKDNNLGNAVYNVVRYICGNGPYTLCAAGVDGDDKRIIISSIDFVLDIRLNGFMIQNPDTTLFGRFIHACLVYDGMFQCSKFKYTDAIECIKLKFKKSGDVFIIKDRKTHTVILDALSYYFKGETYVEVYNGVYKRQ